MSMPKLHYFKGGNLHQMRPSSHFFTTQYFFRHLFWPIFTILTLGALSAYIAYVAHPIPLRPALPSGLAWVTPTQAQDLDPIYLDARSQALYDAGHIPGALRLSMGDWSREFPLFVGTWRPGRAAVVYCDGHGCQASIEVATRLKKAIPTLDVRVLEVGYSDWKGALR